MQNLSRHKIYIFIIGGNYPTHGISHSEVQRVSTVLMLLLSVLSTAAAATAATTTTTTKTTL